MSTLVQRSVLDASGFPLDQIQILGIAARGFHGVLESEREAGQDFSADVTLYLDTRAAARDDDLDETVNYALVAQDVVDILSGEPVDLIETVAEQIAAAILDRPLVASVDVTVHKPQAPIPVPFSDVTVTINRDRLNVPVVTSPVAPALDELPASGSQAEPLSAWSAEPPAAADPAAASASPAAAPAAEPAARLSAIPAVEPDPVDLPEAFEPVAVRVDEVDSTPEGEAPRSSATPTLDLPLGVLTAPVAAREADPASYGTSELHLESDLVHDDQGADDDRDDHVGPDDTDDALPGDDAPPVDAVLPLGDALPVDEAALAEQARLSEEVRRPEVFGLRPRTEVHDRDAVPAQDAEPEETPAAAEPAPAAAVATGAEAVAASGSQTPSTGSAGRDDDQTDPADPADPTEPAAPAAPTGGPQLGAAFFAAASAAVLNASRDRAPLSFEELLNPAAAPAPSSASAPAEASAPVTAPAQDERGEQETTQVAQTPAAVATDDDTAAGGTQAVVPPAETEPVAPSAAAAAHDDAGEGDAARDEAARDEGAHDEAAHDETAHDEAAHGEAAHDEAAHGEAAHHEVDEAEHDEASDDEASHDKAGHHEVPQGDLLRDEPAVVPEHDDAPYVPEFAFAPLAPFTLPAPATHAAQSESTPSAEPEWSPEPTIGEPSIGEHSTGEHGSDEHGTDEHHTDERRADLAVEDGPVADPALDDAPAETSHGSGRGAQLDETVVLEPVVAEIVPSEPAGSVAGDTDGTDEDHEPAQVVSATAEPTDEDDGSAEQADEDEGSAEPADPEHESAVDQLATPTSPVPVVVLGSTEGASTDEPGAPDSAVAGLTGLSGGTHTVGGPFGDLSETEHAHQMPLQLDRMDARPDEPVDVVLALGANLGDAQGTLRRAVAELGTLTGVDVVEVGPLARTAAVGGPEQPDFLNTVVIVRTTLSPRELLLGCQSVESGNGRVRDVRWGPRTLDIDIVVYGNVIGSAPDLELPHPRANERAFVLAPWAHLSPDAHLPGLGGGPVAALAATAHDREGIRWLALDWLHDAEVPTAAQTRRPATVAPALTAVQVVSVPQPGPADQPVEQHVDQEHAGHLDAVGAEPTVEGHVDLDGTGHEQRAESDETASDETASDETASDETAPVDETVSADDLDPVDDRPASPDRPS